MLVLLAVCAFVAMIMYKLVGLQLYWILSMAAVAYLYWSHGGERVKKQTKSSDAIVEFMRHDTQLVSLIDQVAFLKKRDKWTWTSLSDDIYRFIGLYLECFTKSADSFQKMIDLRREILNKLSYITISGIDIPEVTIIGFGECTWKYVQIIIVKYDLPYTYPVAANTADPRDLH